MTKAAGRMTDEKTTREAFLDEIVDELSKGNRLEFREFGVFESRIRASREAQNPKTLVKVVVPSKRTVKFKVGRVMRRRLDESPTTVDEATGLMVTASANRKQQGKPSGAVPAPKS